MPDSQSVKQELIILGAGGHAVSVANVAISAGYLVRSFVDPNKGGQNLLGINIVSDISKVVRFGTGQVAIALGDNAARERVYQDLQSRYPNLHFPVLVHRSATVCSFTEIGPGTILMPGAIAGPNSRVGKFCIINTRASIDHDCTMLDFSSLAPAAVAGGKVHIGMRSAISLDAVIKHGLKIGNDSVLGASSYLHTDMPDNHVAYGTPARLVRTRKLGDRYLD